MRICIVGGGKVGYYLAKTLLDHHHQPVLVEQDKETCVRIANELDIPVIHGDGASVETLLAAKCGECKALACVSGLDEVNLIAAQLGKKVFNVPKTVARVNNPKNAHVLKMLGVDMVVSSTYSVAHAIEHEVEFQAITHLLTLEQGVASMIELLIPENFKYNGQTFADIPVPEDIVAVSLTRGTEFMVPRGNTTVYGGDRLIVVGKEHALHQLAHNWKLE